MTYIVFREWIAKQGQKVMINNQKLLDQQKGEQKISMFIVCKAYKVIYIFMAHIGPIQRKPPPLVSI